MDASGQLRDLSADVPDLHLPTLGLDGLNDHAVIAGFGVPGRAVADLPPGKAVTATLEGPARLVGGWQDSNPVPTLVCTSP